MPSSPRSAARRTASRHPSPGGRQVKNAGRRAVGLAQENPLGLALAGAAVGFVAGLFAPSTRIENERLGSMADQVKSSATDAGHEAMQHGKDVASAAVQSAVDTAREEGQSHADELQDSLQQKVHQASPAAS
jgi:gas vesicle protein